MENKNHAEERFAIFILASQTIFFVVYFYQTAHSLKHTLKTGYWGQSEHWLTQGLSDLVFSQD